MVLRRLQNIKRNNIFLKKFIRPFIVTYIFFSVAIKYVKALDAIIYPVIEPLVNPILTFLFLGELMSNTAVFGGVLVIIGVVGRGLYQNLYSNQ